MLGSAEALRSVPRRSTARLSARRPGGHASWDLSGRRQRARAARGPGEARQHLRHVRAGRERRAVYRKIHMFDVDVGDVSYRESEVEQAGDEIALGEAGGPLVGLTICYDLRFPELYRVLALRGARLITVPSAFTERTGRDHWAVLIRARAVENQVFVVAAAQIGFAPPHYRSYGRSMIVDPWGVVMAQAADTECFIWADLDFTIRTRCEAACRRCATVGPRPSAAEPEADATDESVAKPTGAP